MKTEYDFFKELLITESYKVSCRSINIADLAQLITKAEQKYLHYLLTIQKTEL